eukprot:7379711-Prymnesium_polylepis.3
MRRKGRERAARTTTIFSARGLHRHHHRHSSTIRPYDQRDGGESAHSRWSDGHARLQRKPNAYMRAGCA